MTTIYGDKANSYWKTRVDYTVTNTDSLFTEITAKLYIYRVKDCEPNMSDCRPCYLECNGKQVNFYPTGEKSLSSNNPKYLIGTTTFTIPKTTSEFDVTLTGYIKKTGGLAAVRGSSTASAAISIPIQSYEISYDANGGEDPPASQNKIHGTDLTIAAGVPTRAGYDFISWNTAIDGSGTSYASGSTYSDDASTTLFAQWHLSYVPPQIENLRAYRVANGSSGYNPNVLSSGTKCYVDFEFTDAVAGTVTISAQFDSQNITSVGTNGNIKYLYSGDNHLPTTSKETITIALSVTDYKGNAYSYTYATFVSTENYIFDAYKGSEGSEEYQAFAVGGIARDFGSSNRSSKGNFDCYMQPTFYTMAGEIKMWAGNTIPDGWLLCDGSEISKTAYPNLYEAIGDLWGVPNSSSNFKLPNLAGKVPVGYASADTDFDTVGKTGGEKTHTLTVDEMPQHRHYLTSSVYRDTSKQTLGTGSQGYPNGTRYSNYVGGSQAHNNMQPYAVIKYIICAI